MKLTICLSKTIVIFYSILAIPITIGSFYNLVYGLVLNQNSIIYIGAFSLFGFILLPLLIISSYRNNKCVIETDKIIIGKSEYLSSAYNFVIQEKHLPFKERPIFFLLRKTYYDFVIKEKATGKVISITELNVFQRDVKKIKSALL
ncbi:hypothetical protein [Flavobacterium chilense]|uniref:Uncharacterized protein n=1 Tax=Flavobacterium chilense TaxID=946677 RepID=A0A1M7DTM8_9FLAO|nr:hypothetical protein [Flavobacterium chilense]SHL82842.1 hypothetical protein SAMN05444484_102719 [Flavobacterium chilense]